MRFEKIWMEQCAAAESIRERFGAEAAADYLVGEKLPAFAEAAATRPSFARELPSFVGEARRLFSRAERAASLSRLEASTARLDTSDGEIDIIGAPKLREAHLARIAELRALLLAEQLGTA